MAWKLQKSDEVQIDPFNAPDPVMPSEEPSFEGFDANDGAERLSRHESRRRLEQVRHKAASAYRPRAYDHGGARQGRAAAHGSSPTVEDRPINPVRPTDAPSAEGEATARADDASSAQASPRTRSGRHDRHTWHPAPPRARDASAAARKRGRALARVRAFIFFAVAVVVAASIAGPAFRACDAAFDGLMDGDDDYSYSSDEYDSTNYDGAIYDQVSTDLDTMAQDETVRTLDAMIAGDDRYLDRAEQRVDYLLGLYCDHTADELGIDARELAAWLLGRMTYSIESSYCYGDATDTGYAMACAVYFTLEAPSADDVILAMDGYLPDGLSLYAIDGPLDAAGQEAVRDALDKALADPSLEMRELYMGMDYEGTADLDGSNCSVALDRDAWEQSIDTII